MKQRVGQLRKKRNNEGFSLLEMMVAVALLTIAMLGGLIMVVLGIGRSGAMRMDTTSANVAQTVLEDIASVQPKANPALTITDCIGNVLTINTAPGGAILVGANPGFPGTNPGDIDFTQGAVAGYQANYVMCAPGGFRVTYDVRWNIAAVGVDPKGKTWGKLVTVAALQRTTVTNGAIYYTPPVTLRTVVGM